MDVPGIDIPPLPPRPEDAHKGSFGHVAVVGGSRPGTPGSVGLSGAPVLAGRAALRIGAGLVTVAGPGSVTTTAVAPFPELMTLPLKGEDGALTENDIYGLLALFEKRVSVVAVGPGMGRAAGTRAFVRGLLSAAAMPAVVDADALFPFTKNTKGLSERKEPTVITPHPGEAARLLGVEPDDIQRDRPGAVRCLADETGAVAVLKGHETLVAEGDKVYVNGSGGPELAKGGSGDVLTGVIAGLLAQGMAPFDAAVLGVYLHGLAGELAARLLGLYSVLAEDVINKLPLACRVHCRERSTPSSRPGTPGSVPGTPGSIQRGGV